MKALPILASSFCLNRTLIVNKVVLGHSHINLFKYYLWLLSSHS